MDRYFNQISGVGSANCTYSQKSEGLPDENITAPATKDYKLNPVFGNKTKREFNGTCLKQDKDTFHHEKQQTFTLFMK